MSSSPTNSWAQAQDLADELGEYILELEQSSADAAENTTAFDPRAQALKNLAGRVSKLKGMVSRRSSPVQTIAACSTVQSRLNARIETGECSEEEVDTLVECQEVLTALVHALQAMHDAFGGTGEGDDAAELRANDGRNGWPRALQVILFQFELLATFFNRFLGRKRLRKHDVVAVEQRITQEDEEAVEEIKKFWEAQQPEAYLEDAAEEERRKVVTPSWPEGIHSEEETSSHDETIQLPRLRLNAGCEGGEESEENGSGQKVISKQSLRVSACFKGSSSVHDATLNSTEPDGPTEESTKEEPQSHPSTETLQTESETPESKDIWQCFNKAMELQADGEYTKAVGMYNEALRISPDSLGSIGATCQLNRAACLVDLGEVEEAMKAYEEAALFFSPKPEFHVDAARAHLALAELYRIRHMHEEAIKHASLAWPRCVDPAMTREAFVLASLSLLSGGDTISSIACLRQCDSHWAKQMATEIARCGRLELGSNDGQGLDDNGSKSHLKTIVDGLESKGRMAWQSKLAAN